MTARTNPRAQLAALYAQVPDIDCTGKCATQCSSFPIPRIEKRIIRRATGVDLGPKAGDPRTSVCPLLTPDRRCGAHDVRPLICRIWGATALFPCPHGCRPTTPPLTMGETYRLLADVWQLSGHHTIAARCRHIADQAPELLQRVAPAFEAFIGGRITGDQAQARIDTLLRADHTDHTEDTHP